MILPAASSAHAPLPAEPGPGPTGPPTNGLEYIYGGNKIGLQWTNGDSAAFTEIGRSSSGEPSSAQDSVAPGVTTYETGTTTSDEWWVRHARNGQFSAWAKISPGI